MAERRETPRARVTISCQESEWERIREVAESRDVSMNDHVISAGLNVELDPAQTDAPALALSEAEQRRLLDRVDRLAESMLSGGLRGVDRPAAAVGRTAAHGDVARPCPAGPGARARAAAGGNIRPQGRAGRRRAVNGGGIMLHAERPDGPVAAAQKCAIHGPLSVATRGGGCTAWSSMRRFDWRLSTRV